ncbi:MAG TPA: ABC transporter ATP-binding protein [Thermoanaerobaculia bacterium]
MSAVRIEKLSKTYTLGNEEIGALKRIDLTVREGEFLAIAGPSGSGKSTLLNMIGCIDRPTSGSIWIGSNAVAGRTADELAALRLRMIGFIFQTFNLLPVLSAEENVEYPLLQMKELTRGERRKRVARYLEVVGLESQARQRPNELSGGQRQRVAVARALVTRPQLVLADEPTANLDSQTGANIIDLMKDMNRKDGTTFIFSTHDPSVMDMADRVVEVNDGELTEQGIFKTWDVREELALLEENFEELLVRAFNELPADELARQHEQLRYYTRKIHRPPDDWADQTLVR